MTLPLHPAPRLSDDAMPLVLPALPPPPADLDLAYRQFTSGAQGERDLVERELLGHAMGSEVGLRELRKLSPREFSIPINELVARTIVELADAGKPHDAAAVTETLRNRPLHDGPALGPHRNTQLPSALNPAQIKMGKADPASVGLGAWETVRMASDARAPQCAVEIRAHHRRDLGMAAARRAWHRYNDGLDIDRTGRLVEDGVGQVTKDLADHLVSIPRGLTPPLRPAGLSTDLRLPDPPKLGPAAQAVLRRPA